RDGEEAMFGDRRVGEHLVADAAIGDRVLAQAQRVGDDRGHRRDAGDIDLLQLLDPAEDVAELGRERLDLGIADGDAGELRDMANGGGVYGHEAPLAPVLRCGKALAQRVSRIVRQITMIGSVVASARVCCSGVWQIIVVSTVRRDMPRSGTSGKTLNPTIAARTQDRRARSRPVTGTL